MGSMLPYIAAPWILWVCYHLFTIPTGDDPHITWPAAGPWMAHSSTRQRKKRQSQHNAQRRLCLIWWECLRLTNMQCLFSRIGHCTFFSHRYLWVTYMFFSFHRQLRWKLKWIWHDLARIKLAQTCFVCISDVPKRLVWSFRGSGPAPSENRDDKAWPLPLLEIDLNPRPVKGGDVVGASGAASCARASNDCEWCTCDGWAEIFYDFSCFCWCFMMFIDMSLSSRNPGVAANYCFVVSNDLNRWSRPPGSSHGRSWLNTTSGKAAGYHSCCPGWDRRWWCDHFCCRVLKGKFWEHPDTKIRSLTMKFRMYRHDIEHKPQIIMS